MVPAPLTAAWLLEAGLVVAGTDAGLLAAPPEGGKPEGLAGLGTADAEGLAAGAPVEAGAGERLQEATTTANNTTRKITATFTSPLLIV